jgi:hypothetical protein
MEEIERAPSYQRLFQEQGARLLHDHRLEERPRPVDPTADLISFLHREERRYEAEERASDSVGGW